MFPSYQVGAEIPVDSDDADTENKDANGSTLLCVFERGYCLKALLSFFPFLTRLIALLLPPKGCFVNLEHSLLYLSTHNKVLYYGFWYFFVLQGLLWGQLSCW
jgi:hypothetical protein